MGDQPTADPVRDQANAAHVALLRLQSLVNERPDRDFDHGNALAEAFRSVYRDGEYPLNESSCFEQMLRHAVQCCVFGGGMTVDDITAIVREAADASG